jgi:hypothetical protein
MMPRIIATSVTQTLSNKRVPQTNPAIPRPTAQRFARGLVNRSSIHRHGRWDVNDSSCLPRQRIDENH